MVILGMAYFWVYRFTAFSCMIPVTSIAFDSFEMPKSSTRKPPEHIAAEDPFAIDTWSKKP